MKRYEGKVAVITGGGGEIASCLALRLGQEGARIVLVEKSEERGYKCLDNLKDKRIEGKLVLGDVGDENVAHQAVVMANESWGKIDLLVNNAVGSEPYANLWELDDDAFDKSYRTNLRATFIFTKLIIPYMINNGYGRVVNIASVAGKEGNPKMAPYSSTKSGIIGFTKAVAKEVVNDGVIVNCVTPAVIMTRPVREGDPKAVTYMKSKIPMGRFGEVYETANMIAWLLSEACSFTTGAVFDVSGGRATY
tara:strand:+ start:156 stop:905 length:750 start_codon:yes stop_codon:yes gene_type:complete